MRASTLGSSIYALCPVLSRYMLTQDESRLRSEQYCLQPERSRRRGFSVRVRYVLNELAHVNALRTTARAIMETSNSSIECRV